jgi:hypothetical protein
MFIIFFREEEGGTALFGGGLFLLDVGIWNYESWVKVGGDGEKGGRLEIQIGHNFTQLGWRPWDRPVKE